MSHPDLPPPVPEESVAAFRAASGDILRVATAAAMEDPAAVERHGDAAEQLIGEGFGWVVKGIDAAIAFHTVELLDDQMRWAMDRLPVSNVDPEAVLTRLRIVRDAIVDRLPAVHADAIVPYADWMISRQASLMEPGS